jgi:hypothetical protein
MQTIERKVNTRARAKQTAPDDSSWIRTMNILEQELERLNALFTAASFMLCEQDFQGLSRLRQSHLILKAKMAEYFQRFRNPCRRLRRNTRKSQVQTRNNLQFELQDLSSHLQKFKHKLLKVSVRSRSYL